MTKTKCAIIRLIKEIGLYQNFKSSVKDGKIDTFLKYLKTELQKLIYS